MAAKLKRQGSSPVFDIVSWKTVNSSRTFLILYARKIGIVPVEVELSHSRCDYAILQVLQTLSPAIEFFKIVWIKLVIATKRYLFDEYSKTAGGWENLETNRTPLKKKKIEKFSKFKNFKI